MAWSQIESQKTISSQCTLLSTKTGAKEQFLRRRLASRGASSTLISAQYKRSPDDPLVCTNPVPNLGWPTPDALGALNV